METNPIKKTAQSLIKDIKRKTNRTYSSEEKIRIVIEGMRGEESVTAICRKYGINDSLYYKWTKDFMEAGKKRLSGDTERNANTISKIILTRTGSLKKPKSEVGNNFTNASENQKN